MVIHKVTTEPYRVNRVITNNYFDIKAGDTKHFIYLYSLSHKMKWHSVSRRPSTSPPPFCVASTQQLRINAGHSFTAHMPRFVLQGGVDFGKVHPRMLECSSVEYSKSISTMEIKKYFKTRKAKNKLRMGMSPVPHPASCTMGTVSFPGIKSGRGVTLTPHSRNM
jgi:hypothetical protein